MMNVDLLLGRMSGHKAEAGSSECKAEVAHLAISGRESQV